MPVQTYKFFDLKQALKNDEPAAIINGIVASLSAADINKAVKTFNPGLEQSLFAAITPEMLQKVAASIDPSVAAALANLPPVFLPFTLATYTDTAGDDQFAAADGTFQASDLNNNTLIYGLVGASAVAGNTYNQRASSAYGDLYLNTTTGAYRFVPNEGTVEALAAAAYAEFSVTVSDGTFTVSKAFTVALNGVNDAPVVANVIADQSVIEDTAWNFRVPANAFSDVDNATLSLSAALGNGAALPAWLSFDAGTRTFTGTPPQDFNGQVDLKVTASDGSLTASDSFTLTVTAVNDAPLSIERVSIASDGTDGNGPSYNGYGPYTTLSADGRFATFYSEAANLVAGDNNGQGDFFVFDRADKSIERIPANNPYPGGPILSSISADGRYIAFASYANDLVPNDSNGKGDIFVYDQVTHTTQRIDANLTPGADSASPLISADGQFVAFSSYAALTAGDTNSAADIFVSDLSTQTIERLLVGNTQPNNSGQVTSISADGRYVGVFSAASNLVAGDTNNVEDTFVFDRALDQIDRVSIATDGTQANDSSGAVSLSADGRYAAFDSFANNLVVSDSNGVRDVFVFDRVLRTTERVSIGTDGTQSNAESSGASISADGRFVAFYSLGSTLVAGDTNSAYDVFVYDRETHVTVRASLAADGAQGNGNSFHPVISSDGQLLTFDSDAANLVANDTNNLQDVFVVSLPQLFPNELYLL